MIDSNQKISIRLLTKSLRKGIRDEIIPKRAQTHKYMIEGGLLVLTSGADDIGNPDLIEKLGTLLTFNIKYT